MPDIAVVQWDHGRLRVNAAFAGWLEQLHLTTWDAFAQLCGGTVYRRVGQRVTSRLVLGTGALQRTVFLKRHGRLPWHERWKAWTRLQTPIWGARPEWDALLQFHRLGIPTLTPIACGEEAGSSFLLTEAFEPSERLDHWLANGRQSAGWTAAKHQLGCTLARMVRQMHDAGWHHQDLYLCHILRPSHPAAADQLHMIDLGRVQRHGRMGARRWIVKDLAQLNFSAQGASRADRLRFLMTYLNRPLGARDKWLVRSILRKSARIAAHTRKRGL
jgi:heptose I phosphotransferase